MTQIVIIGEADDPHVAAVVAHIEDDPLVVDAQSLRDRPYVLGEGRLTIAGTTIPTSAAGGIAIRGWIRRIVPDSWLRSVRADSRHAVEASAWTSLLAAVLQFPSTAWLTPVGAITRAENKLTQAMRAAEVGIQTPRTIVTNDATLLTQAFDNEIVLKPLGAGHYVEEGQPFTVHATAAETSSVSNQSLAVAPFLIQERLNAYRHWRVVTVAEQVWTAALDAKGYSLDWRRDALAHTSFRDTIAPSEIDSGALRIARHLSLGYSSQDWIETADGAYLIDVNPSGQWLFLPESIGTAVAVAIANWLTGAPADAS